MYIRSPRAVFGSSLVWLTSGSRQKNAENRVSEFNGAFLSPLTSASAATKILPTSRPRRELGVNGLIHSCALLFPTFLCSWYLTFVMRDGASQPIVHKIKKPTMPVAHHAPYPSYRALTLPRIDTRRFLPSLDSFTPFRFIGTVKTFVSRCSFTRFRF